MAVAQGFCRECGAKTALIVKTELPNTYATLCQPCISNRSLAPQKYPRLHAPATGQPGQVLK